MLKKIAIGFIALIVIVNLFNCGGATEEASQPSPSPSAATATSSPSLSPSVAPSPSASSQPARTDAQVVEVVDGDTIKVSIAGGPTQTVRIIGVDTPETKDPRKPVMCFGAEATAKTKELVDLAGGRVQLEKDVSQTDKYDRLLRYVWLVHPDGTRMLNEELVKGGFAQSSTYPPDVKYQDLFVAAQQQARDSGTGLWGACGSFGAEATPVPSVAPPPPAAAAPAVTSQPADPAPATSGPRQGVHPGAFCSPEGATGVTSTGRSMACIARDGEPRARWRSG